MDERLYEAARVGDVMALNRIMEKDPELLERACSVHFADSPLHVAARRGKAEFVKQIVTRLPSLATETNQQGMIPLHLASLKGHVETVRELLKAKLDDEEVSQCLLKDDEGWTPLHCASQKGKISVIEELISECPQSLEQVTEKGETVLHVAVKANRVEAVKVLADSIKHHNFHNLLIAQDQKGKSAYQLAVAKKLPSQVVEVLKEDDEIREENHINVESEGNEDGEASNKKYPKMMSSKERQSAQDAMLVVAALIITLTYQALVNPPTTLFKDGTNKIDWGCVDSDKSEPLNMTKGLNECPAALAFLFLTFNTMTFITSIVVAIVAMQGNRLMLPAQFTTLFLILCYFTLLTSLNYRIYYFSLFSGITVFTSFSVSVANGFIKKYRAAKGAKRMAS